ncbi:MAG: GNAT family N-acetyltransferase, partial [Actinomycetes bacterium]
MGDQVMVRRVIEEDWQRLRAIRLEVLAAAPTAFLETLADAETHDEAEWRFRARRGSTGAENLALAAEDSDQPDRWVGYMACFVDAPGQAHLVSVYVVPDHRGTGLA